MKIIDLLNKIANGEEDDLITEFEFDKRVWNFKTLNDSEFCLDGWLLNQNITITKHKEIIEEEKKIPEKSKIDFNTKLPVSGCSENEAFMMTCISHLGNTMDKIIDYLKSKGDE